MSRILCPAFLILLLLMLSYMPGKAQGRHAKEPVIVTFNYDKQKDQTTYMVLPHGSVTLPGKWQKLQYDRTSHQQKMMNADSVLIAATLSACDAYQFNQGTMQKGADFVNAFYKWESDFVRSYGLEAVIIEQDTAANYILWHAFGTPHSGSGAKGVDVDNYFLITERNCRVKNLALYEAPKLSANQKVAFLKSLLASPQ